MERWDEVLLNQGEFLITVSTARHHGDPPPPRQNMQGTLFTQWTPTKSMPTCCPTPPTSTSPLTYCSRKFLGTLEQQEVPTYGQLLFRGAWRPIWCWLWRNSGMMFSTPRPTGTSIPPPPPCASTTPPSSPAPRRVSTPCHSVAGRCASGGGLTSSSWRRTCG